MFELRINGQKVWSSERQVLRVSMQSARGEIGAAGISPQDGVIDIMIEEVSPGGPLRLDEVERWQNEQIRATEEGTVVGTADYSPAADANKVTQGVPSRDVPAGGVDVGDKPDLIANRAETSPTGSTLNPDGSVAVGVKETGPAEDQTTAVDTSGDTSAVDTSGGTSDQTVQNEQTQTTQTQGTAGEQVQAPVVSPPAS